MHVIAPYDPPVRLVGSDGRVLHFASLTALARARNSRFVRARIRSADGGVLRPALFIDTIWTVIQDDGCVIPAEAVLDTQRRLGLLDEAPRQPQRMPGAKLRHYRYRHYPRTFSEHRAHAGWEHDEGAPALRGARRGKQLPTDRDSGWRCNQRSWKKQRRTQYKLKDR